MQLKEDAARKISEREEAIRVMTLEAAEIAAQRESRFESKPALKQMMQPTGRSTLNMSWDSLIKRANRLGRSMGGPRSARRHAPAPAAPLAPPPPQASPTQESPGSLSHKALMEISPGKADRNSEGAGTESSPRIQTAANVAAEIIPVSGKEESSEQAASRKTADTVHPEGPSSSGGNETAGKEENSDAPGSVAQPEAAAVTQPNAPLENEESSHLIYNKDMFPSSNAVSPVKAAPGGGVLESATFKSPSPSLLIPWITALCSFPLLIRWWTAILTTKRGPWVAPQSSSSIFNSEQLRVKLKLWEASPFL